MKRYMRCWTRGHYRSVFLIINGRKQKVNKWTEGYWRKIKVIKKDEKK